VAGRRLNLSLSNARTHVSTSPSLSCIPSKNKQQDVLAESGVLLFSYPRANTGGCTAQATGHNEQAAAYAKKGFKVFGISADKPTSQANWRKKHGFTYNLLCDPGHAALKALGWSKGGTSVARSHAVIGKGGKVLDAHSPISPKDSVALGLEFIEGL
jgi:thioredoxin-dependent peroxiredoxin